MFSTFTSLNLAPLKNLQICSELEWQNQRGAKAESSSYFEQQKLPRLYTPGAAAYGSARNLSKAWNRPVSKVRHFPQSKTP